jgi:16S rRNA (guanine966-N2)-methyltransferase
LFSGSGALGFEALSRGAAKVVMVENNRVAFRALQENSKKLCCDNIALHCEDAIEFARRDKERFDVIFLDPPFQSDILPKVAVLLANKLENNGFVYVETGEFYEPDATWKVIKQAKAGKVFYQLLQQA